MSSLLSVDLEAFRLVTNDGASHELWPHEYWILCPTRTFWVPTDGPVRWVDFGMLRHNAKRSRGLVLAQEDLLEGIEPRTEKIANAKAAEELLEDIRQKHHPSLPSRLRCHFLNYHKATAEGRAEMWGWRNRSLERCFVVLSGGYFHHADVALYEQLTKKPDDIALAFAYWGTFDPKNESEFERLEVLANSCLYFPDWEQFPEIDLDSMGRWSDAFGGKQVNQ